MAGYNAYALQPSKARERLGQLAGDGLGWHVIEGWPVDVTIRLAKTSDGRMACAAVVFDGDGDELTARQLRNMPLGEIVAQAAGQRTEGKAGEIIRWMAKQGAGHVIRTRPGPGGYPAEHYEQVARLYRTALEVTPQAPMRWLREQMPASEATWRRWLKGARDRGLLGASTPGKAGERPPDETATKEDTP